MRFAVNIPNFGPYAHPAAVAELAAGAEAAGWDGLFVWDHIAIAPNMPVGDPFVILAAVAMRTERMTLGTLVTPIPRRRPWVLARQCTSLDHLSGGRFVLGVGIGFPPGPEFELFGDPVDGRTRGAMLDEGLDVLEFMWSGETAGHAGDHYTVGEWTFAPRPVQEPRIPIWVAGTWPNRGPFRRAARYEGVYPLGSTDGTPDLISDGDLRRSLDFIAAERGSLDGYEVAALFIPSGDDAADATRAAELAGLGVTWAQIGPPPQGESIEETHAWVKAGPPR
jgi:alkanesulfonate monooxygenase SsuD/methylene tetrahydromethanopterin reductase-like flavin-dependent oxidoreductase (luciferase family)